jgi:hypothetical protein
LIKDVRPVADRRTVEVHVPRSHLRDFKVWDLKWEDPNFKQLLFYSRRDDRYPKHISKLLAEHDIISGPIAHSHNRAFGKMSDWNEITPEHQLQEKEMTQDDKGKQKEIIKYGWQWVWITTKAVRQLEEDCKEKAYVRLPHKAFKLVPQPWDDKSAKDKDAWQ